MNNKNLYLPELEHDACGIGFVAHLKGKKSHNVVKDALTMLQNMEHRGGCGCEPNTGDGAGILIQTPHSFFKAECTRLGIDLPEFGEYGVGMVFFPKDSQTRETYREVFNKHINDLGFELLGYREVPTNSSGLGSSAISVEQKVEQVFIRHKDHSIDLEVLERKLFVLRSFTTHTVRNLYPESTDNFYFTSLSHKIIVYKGQLKTEQVRTYYPDLQDERLDSALALVHSRFSTNTFPKWKLAQPFRYIAHNGEINTIRGNVNWMKAKEAMVETDLFTREELDMVFPICHTSRSDSANLDNIIELLVLGGRPLPHVMMMLIPEAWQGNDLMDDDKKAFYEYHAAIMEPWDGPASICFTNGKIVGATLDRNGLRPSRYCLTDDDMLIMASEAGALQVDESKVLLKGRLQPGKMFVADLEQGRIISDDELKHDICTSAPYKQWLQENKTELEDLPQVDVPAPAFDEESLLNRQLAFGYTSEDLKLILAAMATKATEPIGSMGADTPLAVLSDQSQHLSHYFKQLFAQVSNPPIDPIRERLVMSLSNAIGPILNVLGETPEHCRQIHSNQPILTNDSMNRLKHIKHEHFRSYTINAVYLADGAPGRLEEAVDVICKEAAIQVENGINILIISDRNISNAYAPIPTIMATGAIHHHLMKHGLRSKTGLIVEAGDARETHHFATLIGYGAVAINPYLAFETLVSMKNTGLIKEDLTIDQLFKNYVKAINYGLLKIFSKMGISTLQSYQGAQIFEALGIGNKVIEKCFTGTISRIGGLGFDEISDEVLVRHYLAFPKKPIVKKKLEVGGVYQWKQRGEFHLFNPETIHLLQYSTKRNDYSLYKKYAQKINDQVEKACTLRGLFEFKKRKSIPLEEVEPVESIFKRFATGAMSFGSISHEAHSTLAIAMNRIGAKSNCGEGGEDESRFERKPNGDWERSAIKQVASGRFGVTSYYLTNADEIQIKMAQGAKPGEGGQLPGHKVDEWIGKVRHSTPGVGLISPPPHHDIYSIEDLAQLIFDLKNANRAARINVKLVAEAGVGTIAAGVAKAHADVVLIAGHDGGTGASPISSIRHAGIPWELGLAETHQTLVRNNLRSRITVQSDGQIRTGRDLAIAALLGAEEWGISTAALVVEGCIMMRKCHLNTCPVGIATQDVELRKMFTGDPDHVVNLFTFLAQDLREIMASLGFRTVNEMVGHADILQLRENIDHPKIKHLDLSPLFYKQEVDESKVGLYKQMEQDHELDQVLDWKLLEVAQPALENQEKVMAEFDLISTNRSIGTMLSNEVSKKYKGVGLPEGTINFKFRGSAGQSFAAFGAHGLRFELEGEANDYFGKGLSGSQLIIYPDKKTKYEASKNMIIGNVAFYGATSGEAYIRGLAGERFCVRNSGVKAVVEGVGDHACEYMTGGTVVILGDTGRNFAAGMSGGMAYIYDPAKKFSKYCNKELVDLDPMEYEDLELVRHLIENHYKYTGSDVAEKILQDWSIAPNVFLKVMPREYKAILLRNESNLKKAI